MKPPEHQITKKIFHPNDRSGRCGRERERERERKRERERERKREREADVLDFEVLISITCHNLN